MKKVIIFISLLLLFLFVGISSVYAGFEEGLAAYERAAYETAFKEFMEVAEQGHAEAQLNLGGMYASGRGVPSDYVMAYMWVNLSASQGEETAGELRSTLEKVMTREHIYEAQRLSKEFKVKASKSMRP